MTKSRRMLLFALSLFFLATGTAEAQRFTPFGVLLDKDLHPFGPEGQFSHNLQPFAPAELSPFGGGPDPAVGFFATYDRLNWSVGRPNNAVGEFNGDWTWGNRFDLGYMTEDDHGWLFEYIHVGGPNVVDVNNLELNVAELSSGELSKVWRLRPLHRGSIVELLVGMRYSIIQARVTDVLADQPVNTDHIKNNVVGPQAGLRWWKQKGRWTLSTEGRYFYGYNNQMYLPTPNLPNGDEEHRWVHAGDLRAEVTFEITKAASLAVGWELLYFGNGIARGNRFKNNDQDMYLTGVTFGLKINRF